MEFRLRKRYQAEQFLVDRKPWPPGITHKHAGTPDELFLFACVGRMVVCCDTDWIVVGPDGCTDVCGDTLFRKKYERVGPTPAGELSALVDLVAALDGVKGVDLEEAKTAAEAAIAQTVEEVR